MKMIGEFLVGSKSFGLDHEESDTDRLRVWLQPASELSSLLYDTKRDAWSEKDFDGDVANFELGKFLKLGLNGSPNVIEATYSEVLFSSPELESVLKYRDDFISKNILYSFVGLARNVIKKYDADREYNRIDEKEWKHSYRFMLELFDLVDNKKLDLKSYVSDIEKFIDLEDENKVELLETLWEKSKEELKITTLTSKADYTRLNEVLKDIRRNY